MKRSCVYVSQEFHIRDIRVILHAGPHCNTTFTVKVGDIFPDPYDPTGCSTLKVVKDSADPGDCPTVMPGIVECTDSPACDVCEDEIVDETGVCCPHKTKCGKHTCIQDIL